MTIRPSAFLALLPLLSGCASTPPPPPPAWDPAPPSQEVIPPAEPAPSAPDIPVAPAKEPEPERDPSVIVIDEPEKPVTSDLVSASRAAREQRERGPAATTKITNKNLKDFAGGLVTTAQPKTGEAESPAAQAAAAASAEEREWRERVLDLRQRARRARDEIQRLESETASLRRSFYVEDDPYVRDSRIKPAWDRALDNLSQARRDVETLQLELARVLDEGRQAGALPGWLREGIELENDLAPAEGAEPTAIEPPPAGESREPNSPP